MADFITDENIAKSIVAALRKKGFSVLSIREENLLGIPDEQILKLANKHQSIIITHDKDFGFLTHYPLTPHPGIILIRLKMPTPKNVAAVLLPFLMQTKIAKLKGRFTVVREGAVRII